MIKVGNGTASNQTLVLVHSRHLYRRFVTKPGEDLYALKIYIHQNIVLLQRRNKLLILALNGISLTTKKKFTSCAMKQYKDNRKWPTEFAHLQSMSV